MKPLAIDLYAGLGGWAEGLLAEGFRVVGFDIERHDYGTGVYPGQLVLQDVTTLHGRQFKNAAVIVASPPCQKYSYMAMPWSKSKELVRYYEASAERRVELNALFDACFRIQREACEAAGRYIPLIVENVKGAQRWVGKAAWHYGSYYLWGDIPALMPMTCKFKVPSLNWKVGSPTYTRAAFNGTAAARLNGQKLPEGNCSPRMWSERPVARLRDAVGIKQGGGSWFGANCESGMSRLYGSKRRQASAEIAKIPFPLSSHIAKCFIDVSD